MRSFTEDESELETKDLFGRQYRSGNKGYSVLAAILLISAVVLVSYYAYMKSQGAGLSDFSLKKIFSAGSGNLSEEKVYEAVNAIPYDSTENTVFSTYRDCMAKADTNGIDLISKKGKVIWHSSVSMSSPVIKNSGKYLLVADINGMDFVVLDGNSEKWSGSAEGRIINGDINAGGYVAILSQAGRYGGEAAIYDPLGIDIFKTFVADNTPIAAQISPSADALAINCINTSGSRVQTYTRLYDMNGRAMAEKLLEPLGSLYPLILFAGNDLVYMAGDTSVTLLDTAGKQQWTMEFEAVYSVCMAGSRNLAAAVKNREGIFLKIFGTNGNELVSVDIGQEVKNLASTGNIIAINTEKDIYFLNDRGAALGRYTSRDGILNVYFFNKYEAAVITKNNMEIISLK